MGNDKNIVIRGENIKKLNKEVLITLNVPEHDAEITAETLLQADLRGVNTHGAIRMPIYVKRIRLGLINPVPDIKTVQEFGNTTLLDGDYGLGQVTSYKAMSEAIQKAETSGIGMVGVRNSNHFGAAAYYAMMALPKDMIGFACTNAAALMPAPGGAKPVVGNNPIAYAIPAGKELPVVLDMACSVVAMGKILLASKKGQPIPEGWATDSLGRPTTDAEEGIKGFLLPAGGPKGYGLALIVDILSGVLTGAAFGRNITKMYSDLEHKQNLGHFFMAIKISSFIDPSLFKNRVDTFIQDIKQSPVTEGFEGVFLPGEIEYRTAAKREKEGIPFPVTVVEELLEIAKESGLDGKKLLGI